jgi:hypothetical protein
MQIILESDRECRKGLLKVAGIPFGFIPSKPLNYLAFQYFDIKRIW